MLSKVVKFIRLSWPLKLLLLHTFVLAVYTHFLFKYFKTKARFDNFTPRTANLSINAHQLAKIEHIRWSVDTLAKLIGWENVCRHQAYQAAILLSFYRIPFEIYIGFKKNDVGATSGHVWTMANGEIVSGFCEPNEYHIFAKHLG